jgi:hypothetical protein
VSDNENIGIAAADTFNGHIRTLDGQYHSFTGNKDMIDDIKRRISGGYTIVLENEDSVTVIASKQTAWMKFWLAT